MPYLAGEAPSGPAGGGLAGTYPNPTVASVPESALPASVVREKHLSENVEANLVVGSTAPALTTGKNNTGFGAKVLEADTEGSSNTAFGAFALTTNTTGKLNTAVGSGAMEKNTTGIFNVAVGSLALQANTNGEKNTAIGEEALRVNTEGSKNTAVGWTALAHSVTAIKNTALGMEALCSLISGNNNVAVGYAALAENEKGEENVAVGQLALGKNGGGLNTGKATKTVALGNAAAAENNGEGGVFIGHNAGEKETNSNRLYIANTATTEPLIGGNFELKTVTINGTLTATLANEIVTRASIVKEAVSTEQISGNAITEPKIGAEAVAEGKIKKEAVGPTKVKPAGAPATPGAELEVTIGATGVARKVVAALKGNGVATKFTIKHSLETKYVGVFILSSTFEQPVTMLAAVKNLSISEVEVVFTLAPGAGAVLSVVVVG